MVRFWLVVLFGLFAVSGWGVTRFRSAVLLAMCVVSGWGVARSSPVVLLTGMCAISDCVTKFRSAELLAMCVVSGWGVARSSLVVLLPGMCAISDCVTRSWVVVLYHIVNSTLCMLRLTASAHTCSVKGRLAQGLDSPSDKIPACVELNLLQIPLALLGQGSKD